MKLPHRALGLLLALGLCPLPAALAEDAPVETAPAGAGATEAPEVEPPATLPPAPAHQDELALSLAEAIRMALENNLDVEVTRYSPHLALEDVRQSWGAFDPELFSEFGYQDVEIENSFGIIGQDLSKTGEWAGVGGLRGMLPLLGSSYQLQYGSGRYRTNSVVEGLSPKYETSISLSFTQPLLRGLVWNEPWYRVKATRSRYRSTLEEFRRDVMNVVQQVQNLYWALIAGQDQVRVAEKSLETARALLDQTRTQHDVGVVSRVEVVEAEAGVAARDFELIRAQNLYRNAQDELISAVLGTGLTADSALEIQPTDRPDEYVALDIDPEQAVENAFRSRPEVAIVDRAIEQGRLALALARNQRLPRLDGQVSWGNQGLSGSQNPEAIDFGTGLPLPPGSIPPSSWDDSMDDFLSGDAPRQLVAGAIFSVPIPNTSARHRATQAELELRRAQSERRRLEQGIILEVRTAIRNLGDSKKGIEAARRARVAAEEQLRAERIRLEYGESTPFDVLLRESDLVRAQSEEINAFRVHRTSMTGLDRAQGTILRNSNIAIDEVRGLR